MTPYPVSVTVHPQLENRDRLTTAFRVILAIPHLILVGDSGTGEGGLLGAVAVFLSIISWFTILLGGTHIAGIRQFSSFYLRWRVRAVAYLMLLTDEYPPFGDEPYPTETTVVDPVGSRDPVSVAFRVILAIPHFIVLCFLMPLWCLLTVLVWLVIILTGDYPQGLAAFSVGMLRWVTRVHAYMLLMVDEYPPFSLE